ncbi:MAG TPA: P1 family peptidase [Vicinamibacterales bacterium]|nr:P1 family peptidase [Vicinamibacterales bacterium]
MRHLAVVAGLWTAVAVQPAPSNLTLTAVSGVKVGHFTLSERPTGCTAILVERGATAGVDVRGAAPATAETDLLKPVNLVQQIFAISLSGSSAFGLDARSGIVSYLDEKNIGFKTYGGTINVPIVPAASLIDLNIGGKPKVHVNADCGYRAAAAATDAPVAEGNVGAGAGATVGKWTGGGVRAMKAGIGTAAVRMPDGLIVAALVAVNAAGDIIDPVTNKVVAGVRTEDGKSLSDPRKLLTAGAVQTIGVGENTTLGVVATNAALTKTQATKIAEMAHDGYARALYPSHTMGDGDTIFALATGTKAGDPNVNLVGELAAEVVAQAIVRAATQATGIPGYPAARDIR